MAFKDSPKKRRKHKVQQINLEREKKGKKVTLGYKRKQEAESERRW